MLWLICAGSAGGTKSARLVGRLTARRNHQQPGALEVEDRRAAAVLSGQRCPQDVSVPVPRSREVANHQDVGQFHARRWKRDRTGHQTSAGTNWNVAGTTSGRWMASMCWSFAYLRRQRSDTRVISAAVAGTAFTPTRSSLTATLPCGLASSRRYQFPRGPRTERT